MTTSASAASTTSVVRALTRAARHAAHPDAGPPAAPSPACHACGGEETVLADRSDGVVVRHGAAVAKAHAPGTDPAGHRARLSVAAHPLLAGILLPPLPAATPHIAGRPVTVWPYGTPVDPDRPDDAPWEAAGALLALLHAVPPAALAPLSLPPTRGPLRAAQALSRMRAAGPHTAAADVERAWSGLPAWARDEAPAPVGGSLCHGDLHLGQLVRHPATDGPWLLIDVDDLGLGDAAWDLARPAAWYAAGLLAPDEWQRFLGAYRTAGGPAVPADGDPWPRLDIPARALTVQTAALAVAKAAEQSREPDEVEGAMIETCARIATLPTELAAGPSS
ncbi:phosphotransferase [Streptomyces sp. IB2014 016-6]|uniref:phosphotransferase family protein n=1 Tax=Streptomyces sp. IB2014 016-6 TaxID=2517818 RepID=UPI0011C92062|nr:phosphotransferase [Streptomyces sp. IB2014 016-6]TXL86083.1 aminoglycoside phosphotransferase family protein [Streptomyces sp. IB2014 016-6]